MCFGGCEISANISQWECVVLLIGQGCVDSCSLPRGSLSPPDARAAMGFLFPIQKCPGNHRTEVAGILQRLSLASAVLLCTT